MDQWFHFERSLGHEKAIRKWVLCLLTIDHNRNHVSMAKFTNYDMNCSIICRTIR
ncbi:Hypothetical protein FKW44_017540, partial [Caligus rogercresseyi]